MKIRLLFIAFLAICFSVASQAQTATPKVTHRQVKQQKRIQQGIASGELTRRETVKIQARQANIQKTKRAAKTDGVVTKKERAVIHAKQNAANRSIYRKKHNSRDRN